MKNFTYRLCQPADQDAVTELFFINRAELCLPDRPAAQKITDQLFAQGQVVAGFHNQKMVGALGYFLGEPAHNFANNQVLFLYVGAILPAYQLTRLFPHGLLFTLERYQGTAVSQIKLQAKKDNPYTNKLYGRFARPLSEGKSPRGVSVITYGGSIEDAIAYLSRWKRPKAGRKKVRAAALRPFDHGQRSPLLRTIGDFNFFTDLINSTFKEK